MNVANAVEGNDRHLPQSLKTAQEAILLPEIQQMLRRLAAFNLGIYMPHKHDEASGVLQVLPDGVMQVESGLEVSFQPLEVVANQQHRFLPVGWLWRAGALTPSSVCEMVWEEQPDGSASDLKHKMPK